MLLDVFSIVVSFFNRGCCVLVLNGRVLVVRRFPASERGPESVQVNLEGLTVVVDPSEKLPKPGDTIAAEVVVSPNYKGGYTLLAMGWSPA